jgi:hypothetical protein
MDTGRKHMSNGFDGWREATLAWSVCRSLHREYCKKRDPFYTTRQGDFERHEEAARAKMNQLAPGATVLPADEDMPDDALALFSRLRGHHTQSEHANDGKRYYHLFKKIVSEGKK